MRELARYQRALPPPIECFCAARVFMSRCRKHYFCRARASRQRRHARAHMRVTLEPRQRVRAFTPLRHHDAARCRDIRSRYAHAVLMLMMLSDYYYFA